MGGGIIERGGGEDDVAIEGACGDLERDADADHSMAVPALSARWSKEHDSARRLPSGGFVERAGRARLGST